MTSALSAERTRQRRSGLREVESNPTIDWMIRLRQLNLALALAAAFGSLRIGTWADTAICVAGLILVALPPRVDVGRIPISVAAVLYVGWIIASLGWSTLDGSQMALQIRGELVPMIGILVVGVTLPRHKLIQAILWMIRFVCVLTMIAVIVSPAARQLAPSDIGQEPLLGWHGLFFHKNVLSPFLVFGLVSVLVWDRRRMTRWPSIVLIVVLLIGSSSITGMSTAIAVTVLYGWILIFQRQDLNRRAAFFVSTLVLIAGVVVTTLLTVTSVAGSRLAQTKVAGKDLTFTGRTQIWRSTLRAISERPWHGWGWGGLFYDPPSPRTAQIWNEVGWHTPGAHNGILEVLAQFGVIGLVLLLALLVPLIAWSVRMLRSGSRFPVWVALVCATILITSFSEGNFSGVWLTVIILLRLLTFQPFDGIDADVAAPPLDRAARARPRPVPPPDLPLTMANHGRRLRAAVREQARSGSLLTDSVWGLAHDGLQLVVTFASFIVLGRKLGAANYGAYLGMFGVIGPISGLTWGTYLAVLQRALRERDDPQIVASSAVTYALLMGAAAAALASIVGLLVIPTLDVASIVLISVSELILFSAAYVSAALVQASHGYAAASRVRIAIAPAKLIVLGVLLAFDAVSVRNVATGSVIIFGLILTTLLVAVLPRYGIRPRPTVPSRDLVTTSLTFALPMSAASVQSDGDKAVLNFYGMQSAAGLYGAAGRIVSVGMMPLRALDSAAFQRFLPHDPSLKGQHVRRTLKYCRLSLSLCALIGVSLFFAAPHLGFLLGDGFEGSESMIRWLTLYLPALAVSGAPLNGLLGLGKVRTRAAISLASGALSLGLYIALIPRLSWKGAVIGTIVGEVFLAAVGWTVLIRAQRRFDSGVDAGPDESHTPPSGVDEDAMVAMAAGPDGSSPA